MSNKKTIVYLSENRQESYNRFLSYEYPYLSVASPVDVTVLIELSSKQNNSLYSLISYCVMAAINSIPEFRRRIEDNLIYEYDKISTSFSVLRQDGSFGFSSIVDFISKEQFLVDFVSAKKEIESNRKVVYDDRKDVAFLTCLPWMRITSLVNPMKLQIQDTIPRIAWGRVWKNGNHYFCDFSVQVHHSLVDGYHIGEFFINLEKEIIKYENSIL